MAHDVFISHSTQDKAIADSACAALEQANMRCWIAPRDVQPGRPFAGEITRAIRGSKVMVLIFSAHSNNSEQVLREVQLAVDAHLHIIQFRIEEVTTNDDLKYYLSTPHWLDAMSPPLKQHLDRLVTSIRTLMPAGDNTPSEKYISADLAPLTAARASRKPPTALVVVSVAVLAGVVAAAIWALTNHKRPVATPASRMIENSASPTPAPSETAVVRPTAATGTSPIAGSKQASLYFDRATNRRKESDLVGALADYDAGLRLDPANTNGYMGRGLAKYQQGDFDGAIADYNKALETASGEVAVLLHHHIACVHRDEGKFDLASSEFGKILEENPKAAFAHAGRAILELMQGDGRAAFSDHKAAIDLEPGNPAYQESLAMFYLRTRQWMGAIATINKIIEMDPRNEGYSRLMMWIADSRTNVATANRELGAFLTRQQPKPDDWNRHIAEFLVGQIGESEFLDPKSPLFNGTNRRICQAWYFAGVKSVVEGDTMRGVERLRRAIGTDVKSAPEYRLARSELNQLRK